jgi:hypothetical protein
MKRKRNKSKAKLPVSNTPMVDEWKFDVGPEHIGETVISIDYAESLEVQLNFFRLKHLENLDRIIELERKLSNYSKIENALSKIRREPVVGYKK